MEIPDSFHIGQLAASPSQMVVLRPPEVETGLVKNYLRGDHFSWELWQELPAQVHSPDLPEKREKVWHTKQKNPNISEIEHEIK